MPSTVPEVLKQRVGTLNSISAADQVALSNYLSGLIDAIRVVTAKLDADATVTDTNYTAVFDAVVTK